MPDTPPRPRPSARQTLYYVWRFVVRVLSNFQRNRGFVLAGGVAYNVLLSLIPLLAVFLAVVSRLVDRAHVLGIIHTVLEQFVPGPTIGEIQGDIGNFLDQPEKFGVVGVVVLLFFSSLAFRMLQDAMTTIFERPRARTKARSFWISAILPYIYMAVVVSVLAALTVVIVILDSFEGGTITLLGVSIGDLPTVVLSLGVLAGEVLLFASIYRVMPAVRVEYRRALIGGLTAALLWEIVRRVVMWWFANISLVDIVYGSLATVIVVILVLEIAAIILLLGGQIIAELQHSHDRGLPWYEAAPLERTGTTGRQLALPQE